VSTPVFYLVRHAEAEPAAGGGDAARPLTGRGREAFAALSRDLAAAARISRIATSPLLRARQTAEILAGATGAGLVVEDALAPGRSAGREILALGLASGDGAALVGHNPELAEAIALAARRAEKVPPGAVAAVEATPGGWRLAWLRGP
jgi:phosphohistidine phosphatase